MYLLISLIVILISYRLFKITSGSLKLSQLNMVSWIFYYNLILQTFIASILIIYKIDNHYLIDKLLQPYSRLYGWLSVQYVLVAMPFSMLICMLVLNNGKTNICTYKNYLSKPLCYLTTKKDETIRSSLIILSATAIISIIYVFVTTKNIPLLGIFQGKTAIALLEDRVSSSRAYSGNEYIKNLFAVTLTPLLSYCWYSYYQLSRNKIDFYFTMVMIFMSFIILTYDLSKAPIVNYFISFLLLKIILGKKINFRKMMKYIIGVILIILFSYSLTQDNFLQSTIFTYNLGPIGRIILSQSAGTYLSFDIFPLVHDHLHATTFSAVISDLIGADYQDRSARVIMNILFPLDVEAGTAGVINSLFVGEAWANFGLTGVIISPILVGIAVQFLYQLLITGKKHPIKIALYAYFATKLPITGGFNDFIYNIPFLFLGVICLTIYLTALFYKQRLKIKT